MKILVIEDDPESAKHLAKGLNESGYSVDVVSDGAAAIRAAQACNYGLVICDIMMPGDDGFLTVSKLRQLCREVPVIFVTALDDVGAKVQGLDLGADDYLVKPFAFAELLARVRALLRRAPAESVAALSVGGVTLDLRSHSVKRGATPIDLTPKEYALLLLLAEQAGDVVPRRVIAKKIWGMDFDSGTNIIDVQVKRLRSKVDAPGVPSLIQTVRGVGYTIQAERRSQ